MSCTSQSWEKVVVWVLYGPLCGGSMDFDFHDNYIFPYCEKFLANPRLVWQNPHYCIRRIHGMLDICLVCIFMCLDHASVNFDNRKGPALHVHLASKMAAKVSFQSNIEFTAMHLPQSHIVLHHELLYVFLK